MRRKVFNAAQKARVSSLLSASEEMVGDRFKIPSFGVRNYPFDLRTLEELDPDEISDTDFAKLVKIRQFSASTPSIRPRRHFFRICLEDHIILRRIREDKEVLFDPLLLYVLTHELVHIVRFSTFTSHFEDHRREAEEKAVHEIASAILRRSGGPGIEPVLEKYGSFKVD